MNNCSIQFTICAVSSIGLNLHENKIVKLPTASNTRLEKYTDTDGNQFQYFMVTAMRRTSRLELEVTAQAWAKPFWDDFCIDAGGTYSGYVTWPADDPDAADGVNGARTQIYSVSSDRECISTFFPTSIDEAAVTFFRWTHNVVALPQSGHSYYIGHPSPQWGFRVWYDGQLWVYRKSGIDPYPVGTVQAGDQLIVTWDENSGSPERYYYQNSTLRYTDTGASVDVDNVANGICNTTGDYIGDVFVEVTYSGCTPDYAIQPVGQSGTSVTSGTPGSGSSDSFDVLEWQVFNRPEEYMQDEVFS